MSNFAIWIGGTWTTPPAAAMPIGVGSPDLTGAPIVRGYPATARSGFGRPVGVDDELFAVVGRPYIDATGMAWWYTTVGIGDEISKSVTVRLWNVKTQAWTAYSAIMWEPTYDMGRAAYKVTNFMVRFTNLEVV